MFYDISFLWIWLLITLLLGAAVGYRTEVEGPQTPWFEGWPRVAVIVFGVVFVIALLGLWPGQVGFFLECACWFAIAYVAGALAGGEVKRRRAT